MLSSSQLLNGVAKKSSEAEFREGSDFNYSVCMCARGVKIGVILIDLMGYFCSCCIDK